MLTYHAAFYEHPEEATVLAKVLDFPGVVTEGRDLSEGRQELRGALRDMAETILLAGETLPSPNPGVDDSEADLVDPIVLSLVVEPAGVS